MRKISRIYENPIDNILIDISEYLSPYAYYCGLTPNILTTISILFSGYTIYLLLNSNYLLASFMFLISYYFDCMDGHFARKYKMYSKFGDYYDHIADIFKFVSVLYTLFYINYVKFFTFIPSILFYFVLFNIHLGYQEIYYDKNDSDILNIVKNICLLTINNNKDNKITILNIMSYTRYFGCGTFNIIMMLFIIYYGM